MGARLATLVTPSDVINVLKESSFDRKFRIVEATFGPARGDYENGHIKNAIFLDTMNCAEVTNLYPKNLPEKNAFKDYVGSLGISNDHHLIIYDRSDFGFYASSRLWWIFRLYGHDKVSVLNGGLNAWKASNYGLDTTIPNYPKTEFKINENMSLMRNYEQVKNNLQTKKELIVDARPIDAFNAGHIDGAVSCPYGELFDKEAKSLKSNEKLVELFKSKGVDMSRPLVGSCLTSVSASSLALAAHAIGIKMPVYQGSWTEYSQKHQI